MQLFPLMSIGYHFFSSAREVQANREPTRVVRAT